MTDLSRPLSSFPSRPLELDELDDLEESDRIVSVLHDDEMVEVAGPDVFAYNCVLITDTSVSAAVYVDDDETWYRVHSEPRADAGLEAAYDAIREVREDDGLFARAPLTVAEAVFMAERLDRDPDAEPDYAEGDEFDCPVCGDVHTVDFHEEEYAADLEDLDTSFLYVECPETRNDRLIVEFQASTP